MGIEAFYVCQEVGRLQSLVETHFALYVGCDVGILDGQSSFSDALMEASIYGQVAVGVAVVVKSLNDAFNIKVEARQCVSCAIGNLAVNIDSCRHHAPMLIVHDLSQVESTGLQTPRKVSSSDAQGHVCRSCSSLEYSLRGEVAAVTAHISDEG